jgi:hypothetical protein
MLDRVRTLRLPFQGSLWIYSSQITAKAHLYEYTATEGLMAEALRRVSSYTTVSLVLYLCID